MKLYGLNNIVKCGSNIYYIDILGERLHLKNDTSLDLFGITIDEDEKDIIDDIEMSEWLLDLLFKRKYYINWYWEIDDGYTIEKDKCGLYVFKRYEQYLWINTVRELQNAYNFFSEYEGVWALNEDIDNKLKKIFKLI